MHPSGEVELQGLSKNHDGRKATSSSSHAVHVHATRRGSRAGVYGGGGGGAAENTRAFFDAAARRVMSLSRGVRALNHPPPEASGKKETN